MMAGVKKVYAKDMFARLIDDFVKAKEENLSKEEFIPKEKKRYHDIRYGLDMDDSIYLLWEFDIDELIDALDYIFTDDYTIDTTSANITLVDGAAVIGTVFNIIALTF